MRIKFSTNSYLILSITHSFQNQLTHSLRQLITHSFRIQISRRHILVLVTIETIAAYSKWMYVSGGLSQCNLASKNEKRKKTQFCNWNSPLSLKYHYFPQLLRRMGNKMMGTEANLNWNTDELLVTTPPKRNAVFCSIGILLLAPWLNASFKNHFLCFAYCKSTVLLGSHDFHILISIQKLTTPL